MSIRYLTGRSRALRPRLNEELSAALAEPSSSPLIVLVPEQYTLEAEWEILAALGLEGSFRLQIMSPARLISRLFEAAGRPTAVRVDERGRVMLMHAALASLSRELGWYRGAQHRPGFSELAARQIKELKQAGYTPERLGSLAEDLNAGPLKAKLRDLAVLWQAYEAALKDRFMDGEDELICALERVDRADFLRGARIWAYGYELVSPTLASTLTELAKSREVSLLLPLENDPEARDAEAFEPVFHSFKRLCAMAAEAGVEAERIMLEEPPEEDRPGELSHLLREINSFPPVPFPGEGGKRVRMVSRRNPLDEAMFIMAVIRERVMSGKMLHLAAAASFTCFIHKCTSLHMRKKIPLTGI